MIGDAWTKLKAQLVTRPRDSGR